MTNTISKNKLKARMLEVFRQLEASGGELIVTDRNKPVLKIIPIKEKYTVAELFGKYQCRLNYHEDINAPTISEWNEV
jgi:antitoxin (DNA-binding transcriptional repressor) of toxin-antitoxin stability system